MAVYLDMNEYEAFQTVTTSHFVLHIKNLML